MSRRVIAAGCAAAVFVAGAVVVIARAQRDGSRANRAAIGTDTIVMLGDSNTELGDWDALLPTWPIANRGYAGYTTAQLMDVADDIASHRPRLVFVLTGTNDVRDGHPPSWTVDRLGELIDRLQRGAPDTVVVIQTVLPWAAARRAVRETNAAIRQLASDRGLQLLDLYPIFDNGFGALRPEETTDGVHLAAAGYQRWAAELDDVLRTLAPT